MDYTTHITEKATKAQSNSPKGPLQYVGQNPDSESRSDHTASEAVFMSAAMRDAASEFALVSKFRLCESPTLTAGGKN